MVDLDAAVGEHALEVAVADRELQVPAHRPEDDLGREAEAAERPGVGHERCSRRGWRRERRSYPLTGRRSTQQIRAGAQLSDTTRDAVFGSVGSTIAFRTGQADAEELSKHYRRDLSEPQFTGLDNHEINVRLLVGGRQEIFQGRTLPFECDPMAARPRSSSAHAQRFGTPLKGSCRYPAQPAGTAVASHRAGVGEQAGALPGEPHGASAADPPREKRRSAYPVGSAAYNIW